MIFKSHIANTLLQNIRRILSEEILPKHKIYEYFIVDVDKVLQQFRAHISSKESALKFTCEYLKICLVVFILAKNIWHVHTYRIMQCSVLMLLRFRNGHTVQGE